MGKVSLVGTATRYIAGRHALQTVYWRKTSDVEGRGLMKTTKNCFLKHDGKVDSGELFSKIRERYSD